MSNMQNREVVVKFRIMAFDGLSRRELLEIGETDACLAMRVSRAKYGEGDVGSLLAERREVRGSMGQLVCQTEGCVASCVIKETPDQKVKIVGEDTGSLVDPCRFIEAVDVISEARYQEEPA